MIVVRTVPRQWWQLTGNSDEVEWLLVRYYVMVHLKYLNNDCFCVLIGTKGQRL